MDNTLSKINDLFSKSNFPFMHENLILDIKKQFETLTIA